MWKVLLFTFAVMVLASVFGLDKLNVAASNFMLLMLIGGLPVGGMISGVVDLVKSGDHRQTAAMLFIGAFVFPPLWWVYGLIGPLSNSR